MSLLQPQAGGGHIPPEIPSGIRKCEVAPHHVRRHVHGFAVASLLAVGTGCMVARWAGVGSGVWARNGAAWAIGALSARLVARIQPAVLCRWVLLLTPLALLSSLFSSGQAGVHRWISLGPLNWNVAFLSLAAAVVAFAAITRSGSRWTWWAAAAIELVLCLQPDASQATAFAAAILAAALTTRPTDRVDIVVSLFFVIAPVVAWIRPDPLAPVPEVEGIINLAGASSKGMAALCVVCLAAAAASPLFARDAARKGAYPPAIALFVYFLSCAFMPLLGAFPVPLVGMGMSPILGFWLGIGALTCLCDSAKSADRRTSPRHMQRK